MTNLGFLYLYYFHIRHNIHVRRPLHRNAIQDQIYLHDGLEQKIAQQCVHHNVRSYNIHDYLNGLIVFVYLLSSLLLHLCFIKLPVNIPVMLSIKWHSHVLPEAGNDANATNLDGSFVLTSIVKFLHWSSCDHAWWGLKD